MPFGLCSYNCNEQQMLITNSIRIQILIDPIMDYS